MPKKLQTLAQIVLLIALAFLPSAAQDRYIVRAPSASMPDIANRHGVSVVRSLQGSSKDLFVVALPVGQNPEQAVQDLKADSAVLNVEPDEALALPEKSAQQLAGTDLPALMDRSVVNFFGTPVLGAYVSQPGAALIRLADAHTLATGAGTVAFLDTGVDFSHPALANSLVAGYDFTRNLPGGSELADLSQSTTSILDQSTTSILDQSTTSILDGTSLLVLNQSTTSILDQSTTSILDRASLPAAFGHGTMVAGVIHWVAPTAKLMPVKVFSDDGTSNLSQIVEGIYWAVDHGASVINMSFSAKQPSQELTQAIHYANDHRVVCVGSAGNDGAEIMVYPAGLRQVIGVASTDNRDIRSLFSNYGDDLVTVAAPGEGIITLYPFRHYAAGWGTSFSTPMVAGGAALLTQLWPNLNEAQAAHALSQASFIGQELGAGRLDLFRALSWRGDGEDDDQGDGQ